MDTAVESTGYDTAEISAHILDAIGQVNEQFRRQIGVFAELLARCAGNLRRRYLAVKAADGAQHRVVCNCQISAAASGWATGSRAWLPASLDRRRNGNASDAPAIIRSNSAFKRRQNPHPHRPGRRRQTPQLVDSGQTGGLLPPGLATDDVRLVCFTGAEVADAYAAVWRRCNLLDAGARRRFYDCYPFHPATLRNITERPASNNGFQRVRGALRDDAVIHHGYGIPERLIHPVTIWT